MLAAIAAMREPDGAMASGSMRSVAFALKELTASEEARISALVRKAVG